MTVEEHARLTRAFVVKAAGMGGPEGYDTPTQWLEVIVGTAIADTALVLDGTLTIEQFET